MDDDKEVPREEIFPLRRLVSAYYGVTEGGEQGWFAEVRRALRALTDLEAWLWDEVVGHDVLPRVMPEPVGTLLRRVHEHLGNVFRQSDEAFGRYCSRPIDKFFDGRSLTREEFYIIAAIALRPWTTAKQLGLSPVDDYELFCNLCYEDDKQWTYINPDLRPPEPRPASQHRRFWVGAQVGIAPEKAHVSALRPEQREFFERYLPDIYARFKRD